jgi:hypothetical protein
VSERPPRNKYERAKWQAARDAEALGRLVAVEPARGRRADGSPRAGADQVYVMRTGQVFHPVWCSIVAAAWDQRPRRLLVIEAATVGERRGCRVCEVEGPLTS